MTTAVAKAATRPTQSTTTASVAQGPTGGTSAHLVLQGKGGVGKSLIAAMLAQYFRDTGRRIRCVDTDPVNSTFKGYEELEVKHLPLLVDQRVDQRRFDSLMEDILAGQGETFIVDNGASTFLPLASYMAENDAYEVLSGAGVDVVTHCVVTAGNAFKDTLVGLNAVAKVARPRSIVVWLNEFFGPLEHEGQDVTTLPVFTNNAAKFRGMARLVRRNPDTFGADVREMVGAHLTFRQAMEKMPIMAKSRLRLVQQDIYEQLRQIDIR